MKVVLINPGSPFLIRQDVMPPLGLFYLARVLKNAGHEVELVDVGLGDKLPAEADFWGLTGTSAQIRDMAWVAYNLSRRKGVKIAGGPHATLMPQQMFKLGFDVVVGGEGDGVVLDIVDGGRRGLLLPERLSNIDNYLPDRSQQGRYHYEIDGLPAATMMTSRGCPYNCAFCSKDVWGRKYVARSVASVINEIIEIRQMGYKAIMFYDDTFMIGRERLLAICAYLRGSKLVWRAFARSDESDIEVLRVMRESGCREIGVGIESGSQKILDGINKRETVESHRRCIKAAHEVGLRVKGFVIVGLPGETWLTVEETDKFLSEVSLDDVDISILSVYAGSDIYKNPEKYDVEFGEASFYKGKPGEYQCHVSTSQMTSSEIVTARDMLHRKHKKG